MERLELTKEEQDVVRKFASIPTSLRARFPTWLAETLPAVALTCFGLYAGRSIYIVTAVIALLTFNALRLFRQFKYAHILQSICSKVAAHSSTRSGA